jgi:hypothetical protein
MISYKSRVKGPGGMVAAGALCSLLAGLFFFCFRQTSGQAQEIVWSDQEQPIRDQMRTLRSLPEEQRARATKQLALQIRPLPASSNKVRLANGLANLSTEGDLGQDTLQEVATTLADSLREQPAPAT